MPVLDCIPAALAEPLDVDGCVELPSIFADELPSVALVIFEPFKFVLICVFVMLIFVLI